MYLQVLLLVIWASSIKCAGPFHHGTSTWTLFKDNPYVKEVFSDSWKSDVLESDETWVVVLYASWCGGCQRSAPTYTSLAKSRKDWKNVVEFGAVCCSHPDGEQICIDQGILAYPTVKFFGPDEENPMGTIAEGGESAASIERSLLDFLSTAKPVPGKSISLQPLRSTSELLKENQSGRQRKLLLFAENTTNAQGSTKYLGRYVILDVSNQWKKVVVRRIEADHAINLGITNFPGLYEVSPKDGSIRFLSSNLDRQGFHDVIRVDVLHREPSGLTTPPPGGVQRTTTRTTRELAVVLPDGLHEQDLESGIYFSLWREVGMHSNLHSRRLRVIKTYVKHMAKLLPVRAPVKRWLTRLDQWLQNKQNLTKEQWKRTLADLNDETGFIPRRVIWTGCQGSSPQWRGYPCSLWTIFHTMTVAAYQHPDQGISAKDVLFGMRGYITKFLSCTECSKHFGHISANLDSEVLSDDDGRSAVLWLWRTHNKVNKRLHGETTEDPAHPKMQFPTVSECSDCHSRPPRDYFQEGQWLESEVLAYLESFYGGENVMRDSYPYTFIGPTVRGSGSLTNGASRLTPWILTMFPFH